ncbi:DUF547 domain-containing protein [Hyphobacterium sp.]|uniref:DUF547 domain-containing protein n=1 Tax=Hyphobacterium sp. TaxID=2004662 RepID=UPI003BAB0E95
MFRLSHLVAAFAVISFSASAYADETPPMSMGLGPSDGVEYSRTTIDYSTWSMMLGEIVLNVGTSDRRSPRGEPIYTGTRINTGNDGRYRYEANRVIYHLVEDFHMDAISEYRRELEEIPARVNLTRLHPDEQLAYWLNLYTVAVIEQTGLIYPVSDMRRVRAHNSDEFFWDAPVVTILGNPLSLNDIQYNIVYQHWDDPRVIYGFFNGTIGSPRIRRDAYTGSRIWSQLESNAREFVHSLRGVDNSRRTLEISHLYEEAQPYFFPNWPEDVRAHVRLFASDAVMELVDADIPLRANVEEWGVADMTNGSNRCGGSISQTVSTGRGGAGRDAMFCGGLPDNARVLMEYVIERRIRQFRDGTIGNVIVTDLPDNNFVIDMDDEEEGDADPTN